MVDQYADNIFRFIVKNLRHEEDAKDIIQSSFEKLWICREEVEFSTCKSFLFTIAYRTMIDHIRKKKKISLDDDILLDRAIENKASDSKRLVQMALERLNEMQRSLIMLKDYEGYSYSEIGEIMSLNEPQVKVYLHRARLALREFIVHPSNIL